MGRGSGNIGRSNKVEAPVAATVTGARSGTSLSGTFVELGGLASPFLHATTIQMGLFDLVIRDPFFEYLDFDQSAAMARIGGSSAKFQADIVNGISSMGDVVSAGNDSVLSVDDSGEQLLFNVGADIYLDLDRIGALYRIGDISGAANQTRFIINDAAESFLMATSAGMFLSLNVTPDAYNFGDLSNTLNQTIFSIQDNVSRATISSQTIDLLEIDYGNSRYRIGDLGGVGNNTRITIDDTITSQITLTATAVQINSLAGGGTKIVLADTSGILNDLANGSNGDVLTIVAGAPAWAAAAGGGWGTTGTVATLTGNANLEIATHEFSINSTSYTTSLFQVSDAGSFFLGDGNGSGNNTFISGNDNIGFPLRLNYNATDGHSFTGNVGIGVVPAASAFAVSGLQAFANNAAALLGGLAVGDFYRISAAGTSAVAVVQ